MSNYHAVVLVAGLVGSGKSTFLRACEKKGFPVVYADDLWKETIYQEKYRDRLVDVFGVNVLCCDGSPDKELLRNLLFPLNNEAKDLCASRMDKLRDEFAGVFFIALKEKIEVLSKDNDKDLIFVESALGFSSDAIKDLSPDFIISVHCPQEVRLTRLRERNSSIDESIYLSIMSMQLSDDEYEKLAKDFLAACLYSDCSEEEFVAAGLGLVEALVFETSRGHV